MTLGQTDPVLFDRLLGIVEAGSVAQLDGPAVDCCFGSHEVACCARGLMDDGPTVSNQRVHQAALTHVGSTGKYDTPRSFKMTTAGSNREEPLDVVGGLIDLVAMEVIKDLLKGSMERTVVLVEQNRGSSKRCRITQGSLSCSRNRIRVDRLQPFRCGHSFAVFLDQHFDETFDDSRSAMAMDFNGVLLRSPDDHFIVDVGSKSEPAEGEAIVG